MTAQPSPGPFSGGSAHSAVEVGIVLLAVPFSLKRRESVGAAALPAAEEPAA